MLTFCLNILYIIIIFVYIKLECRIIYLSISVVSNTINITANSTLLADVFECCYFSVFWFFSKLTTFCVNVNKQKEHEHPSIIKHL